MGAVETFCNELTVYTPRDAKLLRIGREQDGGYVCVGDRLGGDQLFSYGVGDDISFELDFDHHNCCIGDVYLFDHTVENLPEGAPNRFHFVKEALGRTSIEEHLDMYGLPGFDKTLKMDVEWSEWEAYEATSSRVLGQFSQIVCELHVVPIQFSRTDQTPYFDRFFKSTYDKVNEYMFTIYTNALKRIKRTHTLVHLHPNNSLPCIELDGFKIPQLLEATFLHTKLAGPCAEYAGRLPRPGLDFPNKPWKPEIENFYPFVKHVA